MIGDFSKWFGLLRNINGVVHQQGRLLLDSDWNDQARIINDWQNSAGRDIVGKKVVAIPADNPDGLKVTGVNLQNNQVTVKLNSGRAWIDGLLVNVDDNGGKPFTATYFPPDIQKDGRDAIILEVWQETINAFQQPEMNLLEPALGGPDTTERIQTSMAFRLKRIQPNDTCSSVISTLGNELSKNKGILTVSLTKPPPILGDCPVDEGGGYVGLEHNLYRIEIADVNDKNTPWFKWSQFNGGLVGRGTYDGDKNITIDANLQAIKNVGLVLKTFYLEVVQYDNSSGFWKVIFGQKVTPDGNNLMLTGNSQFGKPPNKNSQFFFRLWNDIRKINDFTTDNPKTMLNDGIFLKFEPPSNNIIPVYRSGDYWIFQVRAGGIKNPETIIDKKPPDGVQYIHAPLAIVDWANGNATIKTDCREIFRPLTTQLSCCSFTVGDGKSSHGVFDSIQDAVDNIDELGGEICLLPGLHESNVEINSKKNIKIRGIYNQTKIKNKVGGSPIFHIVDSQNILLENMDMDASLGQAIKLESAQGKLQEIEVVNNKILAATNAIEVKQGIRINIRDNSIETIAPISKTKMLSAISLTAEDSIIEANNISSSNKHLGGIQIGDGSERILILNNKINGGSGNGITLGSDIASQTHPFIYDMLIEHNEISDMGLSGIGGSQLISPDLPWTEPSPSTKSGTPVIGLYIYRNHIFNCLQNDFSSSYLRNWVQKSRLGVGGIVLGMGENICIIGNRIENNGTSHIHPVCGICFYVARQVNIIQNLILNIGPLMRDNTQPEPGTRGGIVMLVSSFPVLVPSDHDPGIALEARPAARIHDNVVDQPVGPALTITGLGPFSILNNQFNSERSSETSQSSMRGGSVVVLNYGGTRTSGKSSFANVIIGKASANALIGNASANAMMIQKSSFMLHTGEIPIDFSKVRWLGHSSVLPNLPNGNTIFNNNQTRLGPANISAFSQIIVSFDDLGFACNQSDCLYSNLLVNSILFGATSRVNDNRFKDLNGELSLLSMSLLMNATTNNLGNNCMIVINRNKDKQTEVGNLSLNRQDCASVKIAAEKAFSILGKLYYER